MLFRTAGLLTTLACATEALIYGLAAPKAIKPGDTVDLTLVAASPGLYEKIVFVAVSFGWSEKDRAYGSYAGVPMQSFYIGADDITKNFTKSVTFPGDIPNQDGVVVATVYTLYGGRYHPGKESKIYTYDVNTAYGDTTSSVYKIGTSRKSS